MPKRTVIFIALSCFSVSASLRLGRLLRRLKPHEKTKTKKA